MIRNTSQEKKNNSAMEELIDLIYEKFHLGHLISFTVSILL